MINVRVTRDTYINIKFLKGGLLKIEEEYKNSKLTNNLLACINNDLERLFKEGELGDLQYRTIIQGNNVVVLPATMKDALALYAILKGVKD